jgi:ATPase subunit of ABC transporter with duplicated ATPase domains
LLASHDRGLLEQVATKIISFEANGIEFFDGPLADYLTAKAEKAGKKS